MLAAVNQIAGLAAGAASGLAAPAGIGNPDLKQAGQAEKQAAPFSELLTDALGEASRLESHAQESIVGLMTGSGVDVHQAMIATEKASMAFELSLAVRNKAVQAYQQVISMPF